MTSLSKKVNFDIATDNIKGLAKSNAEYASYVKKDRAIVDGLVPHLEAADDKKKSYRGYAAVTQALFESGFLSTSDRDFNTGKLLKHIYGVKCASAVPAFLELHQWLLDNDYNDHVGKQAPSHLYSIDNELKCLDCNSTYSLSHGKETGCTNCCSTVEQKTWNTSGDNYYSAYQFEHALSDSEKFVMNFSEKRNGEVERPKAYDRVIVVENQSPMWAIVLTSSPFSGEPDTLLLVRLKCNYNEPCRLVELLEMVKNNSLEDNYRWSVNSDTTRHGIVANVKLSSMACNAVLQPQHIESALFNIYSGRDCLPNEKK